MLKLIDKNLLLAYLDAITPENPVSSFGENAIFVIEKIKEYVSAMPTFEPEWRQGRLIEGKTFNDKRCSECGQVFRDDICFIYPADESGIGRIPKRCPECGCYWDGGADNG